MRILIVSLLVVASLSILPAHTHGSIEAEDLPRALPLAAEVAAPELPISEVAAQSKAGEMWQETEHEVLIRNARGAKNGTNAQGGAGKKGKNKKNKNPSIDLSTPSSAKAEDKQSSNCRYTKGAWTECDANLNTRSRQLTLKKGLAGCAPTKTIQKKCKKACRYEKGTWSECTTGHMTRTDKLKAGSDPTCEATRVSNKNCNDQRRKSSKKAYKDGKRNKRE